MSAKAPCGHEASGLFLSILSFTCRQQQPNNYSADLFTDNTEILLNQKEFQKGVKLRVSKMKDLKFVLSNGSLHNVQDVFNTLVVEFRPQLTTGVFLVLKHAY